MLNLKPDTAEEFPTKIAGANCVVRQNRLHPILCSCFYETPSSPALLPPFSSATCEHRAPEADSPLQSEAFMFSLDYALHRSASVVHFVRCCGVLCNLPCTWPCNGRG